MAGFTIAELRRRTGVPSASIHHYVRSGLLPSPRRIAPNRFLYDDRHVQRLRLIRVLRDRRRLSLRAIARVLPTLETLEGEQAFRPEMWDRVVGRLSSGRTRGAGERLLVAATEAFARHGYAEVNVEEIARAAGVAKGSFYRHYRSKEELFFAAAEAAARDVAGALGSEGSRPVAEERGVALLAEALQPRLPIFLDLAAGALQRRPGYRAVAERVLAGLAHDVGQRVRGPKTGGPDPRAGFAVLARAGGHVMAGILGSAAPSAAGLG